jgi:hypothetical protein
MKERMNEASYEKSFMKMEFEKGKEVLARMHEGKALIETRHKQIVKELEDKLELVIIQKDELLKELAESKKK